MHSTLVKAACLASLAACSSSTVIRSNPTGAKVFLDGSYVGTTPYTLSDHKIVSSSTSIRLEYPGLQPYSTSISRSEELSVLALIGGIFLLVPFLWIMDYKGEHTYDLATAQPGFAPPPMQPAPPPPGPPPGYPPPGYPPGYTK